MKNMILVNGVTLSTRQDGPAGLGAKDPSCHQIKIIPGWCRSVYFSQSDRRVLLFLKSVSKI